MSDDLDDLLGDTPPPAAFPAIPITPQPMMFRQPVGLTFIAQVVGKQPYQIQERLARCPVKEYRFHKGKQVPHYDFMEAISYIVPPRGNFDEFFAGKNMASLPPYVSRAYWDSAHKRNTVMLQSNDLWHTNDVLVVLGRVAMMIKEEVRRWIEDMPEKDNLTNEQYRALVDSTNYLLSMIREKLVDMPNTSKTEANMSHYIADEIDAASGGEVVEVGEKTDE